VAVCVELRLSYSRFGYKRYDMGFLEHRSELVISPGRRIGVIFLATAELCVKSGLMFKPFSIESAVGIVTKKRLLRPIVADDPVLILQHNNPTFSCRSLWGPILKTRKYGFALNLVSPSPRLYPRVPRGKNMMI